jgi:hypothetical protein
MKDVWIFKDATQIEYPFFVSRSVLEQVVKNDSLFTVIIDNLNDTGMYQEISFASQISKFYASVDDVIAVSPQSIDTLNVYSIAREIMLVSDYVDLHMKPDRIYYQEAFDSAVRCYVRYQAALNLLGDEAKLTSETKQLDTFQVQRSYDMRSYLGGIEDKAYKCALIIWAGGLDTPFKTKTFQKGLYDPNRPNVSRANLDITGTEPWVNRTTRSTLISDASGQTVELRGIRTISISRIDRTLL